MENSKRATVHVESDVHKALHLRAAASDRSVSDMVNDAVGLSLAEDPTDLDAFALWRNEVSLSFESLAIGRKRRVNLKAYRQALGSQINGDGRS